MKSISLFLACILTTASLCSAEEIRGKAVKISDGDTIGVLVGKETLIVRLEGIDSPESKQAFGARSKQVLADLVGNKDVVAQKTGLDRYGRTLATVFVDGVNVNAKLVEDGHAWHYKQFSKDKELARLETEARAAKRGLWVDRAPVAPWEYRKAKKAAAAAIKKAKAA